MRSRVNKITENYQEFDQGLVTVPQRHDGDAACLPLRPRLRLWYSAAMSNSEGGLHVDLALRLNVLVIGAVFVFVGAILLGAF